MVKVLAHVILLLSAGLPTDRIRGGQVFRPASHVSALDYSMSSDCIFIPWLGERRDVACYHVTSYSRYGFPVGCCLTGSFLGLVHLWSLTDIAVCSLACCHTAGRMFTHNCWILSFCYFRLPATDRFRGGQVFRPVSCVSKIRIIAQDRTIYSPCRAGG